MGTQALRRLLILASAAVSISGLDNGAVAQFASTPARVDPKHPLKISRDGVAVASQTLVAMLWNLH